MVKRARLKIRKDYTLTIEVQPGFVQLSFRHKRVGFTAYIPADRWAQLLTWANRHPPTGMSVDPITAMQEDHDAHEGR